MRTGSDLYGSQFPHRTGQRAVRPTRTTFGRAVVLCIVATMLAGGTAWATKGGETPEASPRVAIPGSGTIEIHSPGPVTLVYEGLTPSTPEELGLYVMDASGQAIPVTPKAAIRADRDEATRAPARELAAFEAPMAGRYVVGSYRTKEVSALVRVDASSRMDLLARSGRWVLVGLLGVIFLLTLTARTGRRAPR